MKNMTVSEAFSAWANSPHCTCPGDDPHFIVKRKRSTHYRIGSGVATETSTPRPDSEVCDRERNWRRYVQLRDAELVKISRAQAKAFSANYGFGPTPASSFPMQVAAH